VNVPATSLLVLALAAGHLPTDAAHDTSAWRVSGLPGRVVHDLARLPKMPSIAVLGVGAGAALAVHPADTSAVQSLSANTIAEESLDGGAVLGSAQVQIGIAAGVYALGLATHNGSTAETGSALVETQLVQSLITQGLKFAVGRTRPNGGHYSFPSGHTAASFTTADIVLQRLGWRAGAVAYAAAAYVGASRIADRQHYLSDVVFGAAVGVASARTFSRPVKHTVWVVRPVVLPDGGAAVFVTLQPGS
jgi:membrane-associated phospholipid phosphatase